MRTYLKIRWTASRARDTYGYNVVTLTDVTTGKRYRTMGGGYDMIGTVFGQWLEDTHQADLLEFCQTGQAYYTYVDGHGTTNREGLYGLTNYADHTGKSHNARLDGACGLESMVSIAKRLGLTVQRERPASRRANTDDLGFFVETDV